MLQHLLIEIRLQWYQRGNTQQLTGVGVEKNLVVRRMQDTATFLITDEHHRRLEHAMVAAFTTSSYPTIFRVLDRPLFGHHADFAHIHNLSTHDQRDSNHNNVLLRSQKQVRIADDLHLFDIVVVLVHQVQLYTGAGRGRIR